jgi:hypothetical protein
MIMDKCKKLNIKTLLSGISVLFLFNQNSYPAVYLVPPDIDMYMHQTNDVYKTVIDNLCGAGNNGQGIIKDCFNSLTAYIDSASSYSYIPLANPNINNLSTTIGNVNIVSSSIVSSTINNSLMTSSTVTTSSLTNVMMGSATYCFEPGSSSSSCFSIEDYTTAQYQTVLLSVSYSNGVVVSASSGIVLMPSCTYHAGGNIVNGIFIAFAPTSCTYDFTNPGSSNNVVAGTTSCPSGDSASVCYTINPTCFFGSNTNSTLSGSFYLNMPVESFCKAWSET